MTLAEALKWAASYLKEHRIEDPQLEAEILLAHALGLKRTSLITERQIKIETKDFLFYKDLIERRARHEPTAYITGVQPFMSLDFFVDRSVLIPRPETELLVETALRSTIHDARPTIADIGTGSGVIAVSLAKYMPNIKVIGIDSSPDAIKVAQNNAEHHKVIDCCRFIQGNLLEPLTEPVNVIISNPPYIPSADIDNLQPEVRDWEPRGALDGGPDGLNLIRKLISESPKYLKENGYLIFEFGLNQADWILKSAKPHFTNIKFIKDYSGIDRIFSAQK